MRFRRTTLATAASALALLALPLADHGLLWCLPAIVLFCVLFAGHFPGEEVVQRLRAAVARPRRRAVARRLPLLSAARALMPRGTALLASGLAVRPPPVATARA